MNLITAKAAQDGEAEISTVSPIVIIFQSPWRLIWWWRKVPPPPLSLPFILCLPSKSSWLLLCMKRLGGPSLSTFWIKAPGRAISNNMLVHCNEPLCVLHKHAQYPTLITEKERGYFLSPRQEERIEGGICKFLHPLMTYNLLWEMSVGESSDWHIQH